MTIRPQAVLLVVAAFALAVVGWVVAGWVVAALAVGELDLPARVCGVFFALSLGNAALARFSGHG